jgi:hypothetical protein
MKKALILLVATLFLLAIASNVLCEEIAKEGTLSGKGFASGTYTVHQLEEQRATFLTWKQMGVNLSASGEGPFHNMSSKCAGVTLYDKGVGTTLGYCINVAPDGDKTLYQVKEENRKPGPGIKTGQWKYINGTGKFAGIEGGGEYKTYGVRPAADGTYQTVSSSTGSYKLP